MTLAIFDDIRAAVARGSLGLLSFDVFDTTLLRRCTSPDGVFERAFALARLPVPAAMAEAFVQHRMLAEASARRSAQEQCGITEVGIADIYDHFPVAVFGVKAEDRKRLIAAEYVAEYELCFAAPDVVALLRDARRAGVRVGFVSDTYWNAPRLSGLLHGAIPGVEWDFLYASCDHGRSKPDGLLMDMLRDQDVPAERGLHLGDNPVADVQAAGRAGLGAIHLPHGTPGLAAIGQRESAVFSLFCGWTGAPARLDGGARTARRQLARTEPGDDAFAYGQTVLGPILAAFDRFLAERVARLAEDGRRVAVAFLGRDGVASLDVWRASRDTPAGYIEINRRLAIMAAARSVEPLAGFFSKVPRVNHAVVTGFLRLDTPRLQAFFNDGPVKGSVFAKALPELIDTHDILPVTEALRTGLLAHLRSEIAHFDDATDLVLVDLGYAGTVQRALRTLFTAEGLPHRLHGLYLITQDQELRELPEGDSAEGLISDSVMLPQSKGALLSNVGVLEQMCGASTGSISHHDPDGTARHEPDPRPAEQRALCARIREGAVAHVRALGDRPAADAAWTAAILARALLVPTDAELALLGGLKHDINLGSQVMVTLADVAGITALMAAKSLPQAFAPHTALGWAAAAAAGRSPLHGWLYALSAGLNLPADVAGDVPCGRIEVMLDGATTPQSVTVTILRTGCGDIRLRVPLRRADAIRTLIVPAGPLPRRGTLSGAVLQSGATLAEAMQSSGVRILDRIDGLDVALDRGLYETISDDGLLLLHLPPVNDPFGVLTLTITPLDGSRVLAAE